MREFVDGARLQVFATPDAAATAAVSRDRVAWMTAVLRAVMWRQGGGGAGDARPTMGKGGHGRVSGFGRVL